MPFIGSLFSRIRETKLAYELYLVAFCIFVVNIVLSKVCPDTKVAQQALMFLASSGFAMAFSIWCWPHITKVWANPIGRVAITVLHLLVLYFAAVYSRFVVGSALGLPPQDFDLTVSLVSLALYIPAWSIFISILLGLVAIVFEITWFFSLLAKQSFESTVKSLAHMVGALAVCYISGSVYGFVEKNVNSLLPLVKWVAYFSDYQPAPNYPGIAVGERVRLHENGVVSVATIRNGEVSILVRKHEQ